MLTLINGLDSKKSCEHDDIPVRALNLSKYLLTPLLSNAVNESICDGVLPDNLKIAKVVPIFKSGDSEIRTKYRPISVLTYFSNIFEKVLYVRLNDCFTKNNLLSQNNTVFAATIPHPWLVQTSTKIFFRTSINTYIMRGFLRSQKCI